MGKKQYKILDAAEILFLSCGFKLATTKQIANLAGVGEATLFRNFGDKSNLFQAVYDRWIEKTVAVEVKCAENQEEFLYLLKEALFLCFDHCLDHVGKDYVYQEVWGTNDGIFESRLNSELHSLRLFFHKALEIGILVRADYDGIASLLIDGLISRCKEFVEKQLSDPQVVQERKLLVEDLAQSINDKYVKRVGTGRSGLLIDLKASRPEDIRSHNIQLILNLFLDKGELSVSDLEDYTGLSKTTIIKIINLLLTAAHLIVVEHETEDRGRPAVCYKINETRGWGLFVSFDKAVMRVSLNDLKGEEHLVRDTQLSEEQTFVEVAAILRIIIEEILAEMNLGMPDVIGIYIAAPGPVAKKRGILRYSPRFRKWGSEIPVQDILIKELGASCHIKVDNESAFMCLGETFYGMAREYSSALIIGVDYRLMAGIVIGKNLVNSNGSLAGEIGHIKVSYDSNIQCVCGARGCFRALVIQDRFIQLYKERSGLQDYPVELEDVIFAFQTGKTAAIEAVNEIAEIFGRVIAALMLVYDPEVVVIQGCYEHLGDYFLKRIDRLIRENNQLLFQNHSITLTFSNLQNHAAQLGFRKMIADDYITTCQTEHEKQFS